MYVLKTYAIRSIHIASVFQQLFDQLSVSMDRGQMQGRAARVVARLSGGAPRYQESSGRAVPALARDVQSCATHLQRHGRLVVRTAEMTGWNDAALLRCCAVQI